MILVYHKSLIDNRFHYKITYESNNSQLSEDIENLIEKWKMSIEKFRYLCYTILQIKYLNDMNTLI